MIMNDEIIKIYSQNINMNNKNGSFSIDDFYFFYKINSYEDYIKELNGYKKIKQYYKVPTLLFQSTTKNKGILFYEYNKNIYDNHGLLVDYFAKNDVLTKKYDIILNKYKNVFSQTLNYKYTDNVNIFFKDRIKSRLSNYYTNDFFYKINQLDPIKFKNYIVNFKQINFIIKEIENFFDLNKKTYTVVSQCDPNDLNICEDGMILDYLCGGDTPLMAEFATFIWYYIAQAEYLSLKYNKKAFEKHNEIYKNMLKPSLTENYLSFNIRSIRKDAINHYIDIVIEPIIKNIKFENWYKEFKNYIAMKILAVFNLNDMENTDKILSLTYLILFYNNNSIKDIYDFKNFINNII